MKKHEKGVSLIIILLFAFIGCSQKPSLEWIPFSWEGDTISGKYIEKAFIYIPVKIDDLPHDFTMQLDLGTNQTLFYGNAINPYLEAYTSLADKYKVPFLNVSLQMGPARFDNVNVGYYANFGDTIPKDSIYTKTPKHIGTIAADIFQNKILVIDYKSCRLAVSDSLPSEYKDLPAEQFEIKNGIIMLPFRINGKDCKLMFDTGSSPFPLATSKEKALEIANPLITDSLSGPLWWGRDITFYGLEVNKPIEFGGKILKNSKVYYDKEGLWEKEVFIPLNCLGLNRKCLFLR